MVKGGRESVLRHVECSGVQVEGVAEGRWCVPCNSSCTSRWVTTLFLKLSCPKYPTSQSDIVPSPIYQSAEISPALHTKRAQH